MSSKYSLDLVYISIGRPLQLFKSSKTEKRQLLFQRVKVLLNSFTDAKPLA